MRQSLWKCQFRDNWLENNTSRLRFHSKDGVLLFMLLHSHHFLGKQITYIVLPKYLIYSMHYRIFKFKSTLLSTECYEVFCEKGDGYQPSMCGNGCGGYVKCEGGFAVLRRRCPRPRPYFCCHTSHCVSSSHHCGGGPCGHCGH